MTKGAHGHSTIMASAQHPHHSSLALLPPLQPREHLRVADFAPPASRAGLAPASDDRLRNPYQDLADLASGPAQWASAQLPLQLYLLLLW